MNDFEYHILTLNRFSRPGTPLKAVRGIVIHWVGNPGTSAKANRDYFEGLKTQNANDKNACYASAHFIIGLEGETVRCVPENEIAYHTGAVQYNAAALNALHTTYPNNCTIGIELCHPRDGDKSGGNRMSEPRIKTLITGKDNVEIIRDQIAAILSLELQNQKELAQEAETPDAAQYDVSVYVENAHPYEIGVNKPPLRFVNVILPKASLISGSRSGVQKEQAVFWLDCAATGNDAAPLWNWRPFFKPMKRHFFYALAAASLFYACATVDVEKSVRLKSGAGKTRSAPEALVVPIETVPEIVMVEKPVYVPEKDKSTLSNAPNLSGIMQSSEYSFSAMVYDFNPDWVYEVYCHPLRVTDMRLG